MLNDTVALMRAMQVPGLSMATVQDGAVTRTAELGLARTQPPQAVTAGAVFQAASLSKPLFAYAVLELVERGDLTLDAPLSAYLPEPYVFGDPLLPAITARHVLCHTTGWPNWWPAGGPLVRERPPGTAFGYSGEGYIYLQAVVEHIVGRPLDAYMHEAVLAPLGMGTSSYRWAGAGTSSVATGHGREGQPIEPYFGALPEASSSLHTTPSDYARFLCALLAPGGGPGRLRVESLNEMLLPQVHPDPAVAWGLGWGLEYTAAGTACWHWGDNPGYKSLAFVVPARQEAVVIMTNGDGGLGLCEHLVGLTIGGDHPTLAWLARTFYDVPNIGLL